MATETGDLKKIVGKSIAAHGSARMWRGTGLIAVCLVGLPLARLAGHPFDTIAASGLIALGAVGILLAAYGAIFPGKRN